MMNGSDAEAPKAPGRFESDSASSADPDSDSAARPDAGPASVKTFGVFKLRGLSDDLPQDWWFASTAIPLLAATIGPLSNVLSIAALATPWKVKLPNNGQLPEGADDNGIGIPDPTWELVLNAFSLACGFTGNILLLLHFTGRVRYIIALPLSIIFWFLASGILISITASMNIYIPAIGPNEIYSQGFWYAVFAAALYLVGCIMLMVNMLGYFLGHYPQKFDLDHHQRTLILQTMMFFAWLAGGAAVFAKLEGWTYANALYWSDVSVLTIGFGDLAPKNVSGRGFLFIFELVGIIFLGLVISSITKFAGNIGSERIIKIHRNQKRANTLKRTISSEIELREKLGLPPPRSDRSTTLPLDRRTSTASSHSSSSAARRTSLSRYGHLEVSGRKVVFHHTAEPLPSIGGRGGAARMQVLTKEERLRRLDRNTPEGRRRRRRQELLLLREEKDRFDQMRTIEDETQRFRRWYSLIISFIAFGVLWCVGAVVFYHTEAKLLQLSYYDALYFCWVALLTIGYGDFNPKSNIGKPFFVVWSLFAIPTMTFLLQQMSNTVVAAVDRGTNNLADWTILPKKGILREFLDKHPRLARLASQLDPKIGRSNGKEKVTTTATDSEQQQQQEGPTAAPPRWQDSTTSFNTTLLLDSLDSLESEHEFARHLSHAIQRVAHDAHREPRKRYEYAEWVHFTKLIRFSRLDGVSGQVEAEEEEGLIEWDWIGEDSPIVSDVTEPQWVLDRLCESLRRYTRRQAKGKKSTSSSSSSTWGAAGEPGGSGSSGGSTSRSRVSVPDRIDEIEDEGGEDGAGNLTETSSLSMDTTNSRVDNARTTSREREEVETWAEKMGSGSKEVDA